MSIFNPQKGDDNGYEMIMMMNLMKPLILSMMEPEEDVAMDVTLEPAEGEEAAAKKEKT